MKFVCSLIVVDDINKSRELYEGILAQQVIADYGRNVAFEGGFALHERAHFESLIGGSKAQKRSNNFELYFEEENIDAVYEKINSHGFELVHKVIEQPWRQKVFRFYDYDKNIVEIGEPMPHVAYRLHVEGAPIEQICAVTYLPQDIVVEAIEKYSS
jgi:catechol 2,3-dioxygenase-like lactoylglutathione lyase family enzyme